MPSTPTVQLALYRGPSGPSATLKSRLVHWGICLRTLSRHSHAELVVDGVCYSSSARDGGVRSKRINLDSGRWTVLPLPGVDAARALAWFAQHQGQAYDWPGIVAWVLPVHQHKQRWFCFEAVGAMLGLPRPHALSGAKLLAWARAKAADHQAMQAWVRARMADHQAGAVTAQAPATPPTPPTPATTPTVQQSLTVAPATTRQWSSKP